MTGFVEPAPMMFDDRLPGSGDESAAAESRWRIALESSGLGVWDFSVAECRTFYSETWKALIGRAGAEVSDAPDAWRAFVHPDDLSRVAGADLDCLEGRTPNFECEFRMRHTDGRWVWILGRGTVTQCDADGRPLRMIGTHSDISARKAAEELHRQTGERYQLFADHSTDMLLRVSKNGRRTYVSPACRWLLGWEPAEVMTIPTRDGVHPDDVALLMEAWKVQEPHHLIYRMRRKDQSYVWVESISQALPVPEGAPAERLLVVRDIDDRIAAERKLMESEARYRLLAESATDMIFQLDRHLVTCFVSPASREILGHDPAELLELEPATLAHPDDAEAVGAAFRSALIGAPDRASICCRLRHRDGRWIWVEAELRRLTDPRTGAASGIVGSLRDASMRKEAEIRLEQENRRLAADAAIDGLTGLSNRRAFDEVLEREFGRSRRDSTPIGLVMIDVDNFKSFNDLYGHPAGDACLRSVSLAIASAVRGPGDCVARYGGEEFAFILPNTDDAGALDVAERVRLAVRSLEIEHAGTRATVVTISAGVASAIAGATTAVPDALVQEADRALYAAKRAGRDAVVAASQPSAAATRAI
jgi:diguanylate cyclase (GGDEF)-like protein/PAS domain S-box-containing protein